MPPSRHCKSPNIPGSPSLSRIRAALGSRVFKTALVVPSHLRHHTIPGGLPTPACTTHLELQWDWATNMRIEETSSSAARAQTQRPASRITPCRISGRRSSIQIQRLSATEQHLELLGRHDIPDPSASLRKYLFESGKVKVKKAHCQNIVRRSGHPLSVKKTVIAFSSSRSERQRMTPTFA